MCNVCFEWRVEAISSGASRLYPVARGGYSFGVCEKMVAAPRPLHSALFAGQLGHLPTKRCARNSQAF